MTSDVSIVVRYLFRFGTLRRKLCQLIVSSAVESGVAPQKARGWRLKMLGSIGRESCSFSGVYDAPGSLA